MGLVGRRLQALHEWRENQRLSSNMTSVVCRGAGTAETDDEDDPLRSARGTVLAVALGTVGWAVPLWALLES